MGNYLILLTSAAKKHAKIVKKSIYYKKVTGMINKIAINPYYEPPPFEKLKGELYRAISRRINEQHRLVYEVCETEKTIKIISMWTHYE